MEETPHFSLPAAPHGNGYDHTILGLIGCPTTAGADRRARGTSWRAYVAYTASGLLAIPHWTAMHAASHIRTHASQPNLALTDNSRLSVLSLCTRL